MRELKRFWRSLETVPGLATVPAEWKRRMGDDYAPAQAFKQPCPS